MRYAISVVILTYNSRLEDIKKTIISGLNQKGINFEIIIADDGSKINYFEEIKQIFDNFSFEHYKLLGNEQNNGTCENLYKAVQISQGEYVKPISPQDFLYNENTLINWYKYIKENDIKVSFGKAVYYISNKFDNISIIQRNSAQPANLKIYKKSNYKEKQILIDNLILNDCILGASYICERVLLKKYLKEIIGKIKLCEDFSYRIMLLDSIPIYFFDNPVVYYCFGTGVSSKKNKNGKSYLSKDEEAFKRIVSKMEYNDKLKKKIIKFYNYNFDNKYINRIMSFVFFPYALYLLLKIKFLIIIGSIKTTEECDYDFLKLIGVIQ